MLRTNPSDTGYDPDTLAACIEACFECVKACTACADACLGEDMAADLRHCITTDLGCADICDATGRILSRQSGYDAELSRAALTACRDVCRRCAKECESHADQHGHCGVCAQVCRTCEQACEALLSA
jgi:hypothetical protein